MPQEAADDPFDGCELAPDAILGTDTFQDVLFADETETPVNVLTGETPAHSQATVREATAFAASIDTDTPQIALPASVEAQIETQSTPYTAAAFFHFKTTGSPERHRAYHAAYESDTFSVDFEADYVSGDLTIIVDRADESWESTVTRKAFPSAGDGCRRNKSEQRFRVRRRFEVFEMHMVIHALVEASTHDDALATGKTVFDRLVGADPHAGAVFDYHVTFDEEDTSVAGKARWGELPTAAPVDSDDGQDLLDRGWDATKEEFERNLDRVKEAINELSDEEIMRDEDLARHAFHQVGAYDGPTVFLYNEYANGIRHREQLDRVLEESEDLWIVPADVHY